MLALRLPAAAQAPGWQSARAVAVATTAATGSFSTVSATAVDAAGNVYLAGIFANTVVIGRTTLTSLGGYDVFVAKFNPASNQFVWAQRAGGLSNAGGAGDDYATALAVSGASVYVAGYFQSRTADFGPTTLTNGGGNTVSSDVFVAKLTDMGSTGGFAWAQRAGGVATDYASALAVSGTSVYVAGFFDSSTADFGTTTLTKMGGSDVFVAKLTDLGSSGSFAWAQRAGGLSIDQAYALAVSSNSVYVAGHFNSPTAGFGTTTLTNTASNGSSDIFVAKITDTGTTSSFAWAQRAGGIGSEGAIALAVSGTNVYVAGNFSGSTVGFGTTTLTNTGVSNLFVAKITDAGSTGDFAWAQRAGGTGEDYASTLAVSGSSVYVAGIFASLTVDFGPTILTNTSSNIADGFVAKLIDTGSTSRFVWAQGAGGTGDDFAHMLALSGTSVYVAGNFNSPTANFGPTILTNPNPGTSLGFLASLTDPTLTTTANGRNLAPAQLFPNPAHHTATLRLPAGTAPAPLILTDVLGRAVRRYSAPAGPEAALDLQGLPASLYLLHGAGPTQRLAVE
ncbi:T9SS type A sorting domain-containing protein [Hymenobacter negativus]|uniref:T9SS type A sorting domain-containing protein n=1 Tax=Hymenobacter negativus TaxID=2795026 RepID=UPI0018DD9A94|nr:T9SS type A sorting domain-containing protein [Hymenobacter negativus]